MGPVWPLQTSTTQHPRFYIGRKPQPPEVETPKPSKVLTQRPTTTTQCLVHADTQCLVHTESSSADRFAARYPIHLIALGTFLYAIGPVIARSGTTSGVLLSFWRLWFGVGLLSLALIWHRRSGRELGQRRGHKLALLAGTMFSVNQMLFFSGIQRVTVLDASLVSTLSPVVVGLLAVPLFGERPGRGFRLWSLVAIAGALLVVLDNSSQPSGDLVGMAMVLASTSAFACFFVISKLARSDVPVVVFLFIAMSTAALLVSSFVAITGASPSSVGSANLWRAAGLALLPGTLGHAAMTWPLRFVPANVPPLVRLTGPVLSGTMAWIFLGEGIRLSHIVGGAIIIVGLAGAIRSRAGQALMAESRADTAAVRTAEPPTTIVHES